MLMKPREEGKGPAATTSASTPEGTAPPPPAAPVPPKGEKEGQRPTQPVYQIQNRGMGTAAPAAMDRESGAGWDLVGSRHPLAQSLTTSSVSCLLSPAAVVGQAKLLPPERMKHSIKLVDDQMNWCDSAIEVLGCWAAPCSSFCGFHPPLHSPVPSTHPLGRQHQPRRLLGSDSSERDSPVAQLAKNLLGSAGDTEDAGSIPGSGRCPGAGNGNPLQYSCLGNSRERGV